MAMTENAANIVICNLALGLLGSKAIVLSATSQNHTYCTLFFDDSRDEILVQHPWNWARKRAYAVQTTDPLWGISGSADGNNYTVPTDCLRLLTIDNDPDAKWQREGSVIITGRGDSPPAWATETEYLAGQYYSVTPDTWATGTAYVDGQYVTDGTLIYEVLVDHTSDTIANDITSLDLAAGVSGSAVTYAVATTHTSTTVVADIALTYVAASGVDLQILPTEYIYQVTAVDEYPQYMRKCLVWNLAIYLASPIIQDESSGVTLSLQQALYGGPKNHGYLPLAKSIDAQESGVTTIKTSTLINSRQNGGRWAMSVGQCG